MAVQYLGTTISGLAADTKPTPSANEKGVLFIETDTNKIFQLWNSLQIYYLYILQQLTFTSLFLELDSQIIMSPKVKYCAFAYH